MLRKLLRLLLDALGWRRSPAAGVRLNGAWGTVYVFQDKFDPLLIKVGTTTRLSKRRRGEISRVMANGASLRQVYAVDMPFAHAVETVAHRQLRRTLRGSTRGREWYLLQVPGDFAPAIGCIEFAAREVRKHAARRGRWKPGADDAARIWRMTAAGPIRQRLFS
jgi:hypothetical protein